MSRLKRRKKVWLAIAVAALLIVVGFASIYVTHGVGPQQALAVLLCSARGKIGAPCSVVDDFDAMCAVAREAAKKEFATPLEKQAWVNDQIGLCIRTPETAQALKAISLAYREDKAKMLHAVAAENGSPNWSCPELDALVSGP